MINKIKIVKSEKVLRFFDMCRSKNRLEEGEECPTALGRRVNPSQESMSNIEKSALLHSKYQHYARTQLEAL